jgi:hypothetical protein
VCTQFDTSARCSAHRRRDRCLRRDELAEANRRYAADRWCGIGAADERHRRDGSALIGD